MPNLKINQNDYLYYELLEGDENKPYLIFLHEGLGCTAMWKTFPKLLCEATGCPGLIYDRLGYGKSSVLSQQRTVHYMHDYALQELPLLLEKVIPNTSFILVGHSDGGSISLIYAAEQPEFLKGVITEAAHVFVEQETIKGIEKADEAWEQGKLGGLAKYHGEKTESSFKAWSDTWLSSWFKYWNIEYLLPSIEVPLLVMQGYDDQYGTEDQVDSICSKSAGDATPAMLKDCAHTPHLEAGDKVLEKMAAFVKEVSS